MVSEVLDTIRLLAQEGMTMLIVSHEMAFIREVASRVVFMAGGKIVETGPPRRSSLRGWKRGHGISSRRSCATDHDRRDRAEAGHSLARGGDDARRHAVPDAA